MRQKNKGIYIISNKHKCKSLNAHYWNKVEPMLWPN